MHDIEGNVLSVSDEVYVLDAAVFGSKSKRLLRGIISEIKGKRCKVFVHETNRIHGWKNSPSIIRPLL